MSELQTDAGAPLTYQPGLGWIGRWPEPAEQDREQAQYAKAIAHQLAADVHGREYRVRRDAFERAIDQAVRVHAGAITKGDVSVLHQAFEAAAKVGREHLRAFPEQFQPPTPSHHPHRSRLR